MPHASSHRAASCLASLSNRSLTRSPLATHRFLAGWTGHDQATSPKIIAEFTYRSAQLAHAQARGSCRGLDYPVMWALAFSYASRGCVFDFVFLHICPPSVPGGAASLPPWVTHQPHHLGHESLRPQIVSIGFRLRDVNSPLVSYSVGKSYLFELS